MSTHCAWRFDAWGEPEVAAAAQQVAADVDSSLQLAWSRGTSTCTAPTSGCGPTAGGRWAATDATRVLTSGRAHSRVHDGFAGHLRELEADAV